MNIFLLKNTCIAFVLIITFSSCAPGKNTQTDRSLPLYKGLAPDSEFLKSEMTIAQDLISKLGDKDKAVTALLAEAWKHLEREFYELSTSQFNRAWLIDPSHPQIYFGHALIYHQQGLKDQAYNMLDEAISSMHGNEEKALTFNANHVISISTVGQLLQNRVQELVVQKNKESLHSIDTYFDLAGQIYDSAIQSTQERKDLSLLYYKWAIWHAMKSDYEGAWEKVNLSRQHGGEYIDPKFIESLSQE